ncbi:hypothetical protein [Amycolatopsis rubida]|uniref:hypothetical protein n=1 Tax=Amycolatopsis rubida TaxID=112413 RepID=UPI00142F3A90|nr:hypothetical protein [Amycolatopsis rubida]
MIDREIFLKIKKNWRQAARYRIERNEALIRVQELEDQVADLEGEIEELETELRLMSF